MQPNTPSSPISPIKLGSRYYGSPVGPEAPAHRLIRQTRLNRAPSLCDPIFFGKTAPGKCADPVALINEYAETISDHLARRVSLFYQQLVQCHGSKLHFALGRTPEQGESGRVLFSDEDPSLRICSRNAAHSSTLPALIAYDGEEWAAFANGETSQKPIGVEYLKESSLYIASNATIVMPRDVNIADIAIDGTLANRKLRFYALQILNEAAAGTLDPQDGLRRFHTELLAQIQVEMENRHSPGVERALALYEASAADIAAQMENNPLFFDLLLGVKTAALQSPLREAARKARFRAVKRKCASETGTAEKIRRLEEKVSTDLYRRPFRREAFFDRLLETIPDEGDRLRLMQDLAYNPLQENNLNARQKSMLARTSLVLEPWKESFEELAGELSKEYALHHEKEVHERSRTARSLRSASSLSCEALAEKISAFGPESPVKPERIARMERGEELISTPKAQLLSRALAVDPILFFPDSQ